MRRLARRLSRPVSLSVLITVLALSVALRASWWWDEFFTWDKRTAVFVGANVDHAIEAVLIGGLLGLLLIGFVRHDRRLLAVLLFLQAAILAAALVLVALDGATYKEQFTCTFMCFGPGADPYTLTHHLSYLYAIWGFSLAVLIVQALRVVGTARGFPRRGFVRVRVPASASFNPPDTSRRVPA